MKLLYDFIHISLVCSTFAMQHIYLNKKHTTMSILPEKYSYSNIRIGVLFVLIAVQKIRIYYMNFYSLLFNVKMLNSVVLKGRATMQAVLARQSNELCWGCTQVNTIVVYSVYIHLQHDFIDPHPLHFYHPPLSP